MEKIKVNIFDLDHKELLLLADILKCEKEDLFIKNVELDIIENQNFKEKQKQLKAGYPLDYLLSHIKVSGLDLQIHSTTFIPRWETEEWIKNSLELTKKHLSTQTLLIDMCAGSGLIGLYLAKNFPENKVLAVEIDELVAKNTSINQKINQISNYQILVSDLFQNNILQNKVNQSQEWILYCNPPYVSMEELSQTLKNNIYFEPKKAIFTEDNGLAVFKKIITSIQEIDNLPNLAFFELDPRNILQARELITRLGWDSEIWIDGNDLNRVLVIKFDKS